MTKSAPCSATSPYLLRPRRSLEQARAEATERQEPPEVPEEHGHLDNRAFGTGSR